MNRFPDPFATFPRGSPLQLLLVIPVVLAMFTAVAACPQPAPVSPPAASDTVTASDGRLTQNVVLVIIDGLRYSEGLGDPDHTYTPRMTALARLGAKVEPFLNDGVTVTRRSIPAIWSGSWAAPEYFEDPACDGAENQMTVVPTVFEYFRKHLDRAEDDCVYVLGEVACPWKPSFHSEYGPEYWPRIDQEGSNDIARWEHAREVIRDEKPRFLLLYLPDVDHFGHTGDWNAYVRAIAVADSIVGLLWDTLQDTPQYAGRTTVLVTNDHGRHDNRPGEPHDGFAGHGDECHGCRRIQLLAVGPDVRPGLVSTTERCIPDIAPTIGSLLGFPTPYATGSAMHELLLPQRVE